MTLYIIIYVQCTERKQLHFFCTTFICVYIDCFQKKKPRILPPRCFLLASSWSMMPPEVVNTRNLQQTKLTFTLTTDILGYCAQASESHTNFHKLLIILTEEREHNLYMRVGVCCRRSLHISSIKCTNGKSIDFIQGLCDVFSC